MKKRNKFYIVLLIVILISLIWAFLFGKFITKDFKKEILSKALEKQEVTAYNIVEIETKDHEKYWEIFAEKGHYDSEKKVLNLENVFGNFYNKDEVTMSFKADTGFLEENTMKVSLTSKALIVYKGGEYITADNVTWQGQNKEITAEGNLRLEKLNEIRISGGKAILSPDFSDFKISGKTKTELFNKNTKGSKGDIKI